MDLDDVILLILAANDGGIDGRTTIQKLVYLSGLKIPIEETSDYKARYYGPFSYNVALGLERLVALKFIKEEARITSKDHVSYYYTLTNDGSQITNKLKSVYAQAYPKVSGVVKKAKSFCGLNPYVLSHAAKVYYILDQGKKPITKKDVVDEGKNLEWEITEKQAENGIKLLLALNLVKKTKK